MNLTTSIFDKIFEPKEDRFVTIEDDLLTLSCCLHRLMNDPHNTHSKFYTSVTDHGLSSNILECDRNLSSSIKKYYNEKLVFQAIKGDIKTNYRKDLLAFINTEPHYVEGNRVTKESYIGMAYRLPYFFHYDKEVELMYDDAKTHKIVGEKRFQGTIKLSYIKSLVKKRKYGNHIEYWFKDEKNNKVMVPVEKHNPLLSLFEYLCAQNKMYINGSFNTHTVDNYQFLSPGKWEIGLDMYLREGIKTVG